MTHNISSEWEKLSRTHKMGGREFSIGSAGPTFSKMVFPSGGWSAKQHRKS